MEKSYFLQYQDENIGLIKYIKQLNRIKITYFSIYSEYRGQNIAKRLLQEFIDEMQCDIYLDAFGEIGKETKLFTYYENTGFQKNGKQYIKSTTTGDYIVQPMFRPYEHKIQ